MSAQLGPWQPAYGAGSRTWFLLRECDASVPTAERCHYSAAGELVRYKSYDTAWRAAERLNRA